MHFVVESYKMCFGPRLYTPTKLQKNAFNSEMKQKKNKYIIHIPSLHKKCTSDFKYVTMYIDRFQIRGINRKVRYT